MPQADYNHSTVSGSRTTVSNRLGGGILNWGALCSTNSNTTITENQSSFAGGGDLGAVDLVYIPEPTTAILLGLGFISMLAMVQRRKVA